MIQEDFLKDTDKQLREWLLKIPQFKDKSQLIPLYVAYEFPKKQQYILDFWEKTFNRVMNEYFKRISIKKNELKQTFTFNKFSPLGFDSILVRFMYNKQNNFHQLYQWIQGILINKGIIIRAKDIDLPEIYSRLGYSISINNDKKVEKASLIKKVSDIFNYFRKSTHEVIPNEDKIIFFGLFKRNIENIIKALPYIFDGTSIQKEDDFDNYLILKVNMNPEELFYYKNFLVKSKILEEDNIELGGKSIRYFIYNQKANKCLSEKICFKLKITIEYFDSRLREIDTQAQFVHNEAFKAYKKQNIDQAKRLLRKEKLLKEKYNELADKKDTLEYELLNIESATSNQHLVALLQQINTIQNEFKLNPDEVFDLKKDLKNIDKENKAIAQILNGQNNQDKSEIDEELKRLEQEIKKEQLAKTDEEIKNDNINLDNTIATNMIDSQDSISLSNQIKMLENQRYHELNAYQKNTLNKVQ